MPIQFSPTSSLILENRIGDDVVLPYGDAHLATHGWPLFQDGSPIQALYEEDQEYSVPESVRAHLRIQL